ncbi:MAG: hypothetical protein KIPDCIKN_00750 [Haliscomenobacter sp.]|jgi:type II secretory pathway component PulJ|nr:hypothetical protein [Haliscomenobacter sp.]
MSEIESVGRKGYCLLSLFIFLFLFALLLIYLYQRNFSGVPEVL